MPFGLGVISTINNLINQSKADSRHDDMVNMWKQDFLFKKQQFQYQKELNNLQMEREDTAVQRRAKDLQAAGMNRLMAAGNGADSGGMTTYSGGSSPAGYPAATMDIQSNPQILGSFIQEMRQSNANIAQTKAQTNLINAQKENAEAQKENINQTTELNKILTAKNSQEIQNLIKEYEQKAKEWAHNNRVSENNPHLPYGSDPRANNPYEILSDIANRILNEKKHPTYNDSDTNPNPVSEKGQSTLPSAKGNEHINELIIKGAQRGNKALDIVGKYWDSIPGDNKGEKMRYVMDVLNAYKH